MLAFKDNLTQFMEMWLAWTHRGTRPPTDALMRVGGNSGIVLFRDGQYQVQLFICDPNTEIPDHSHPNVTSYALYLAGDVYFRKNGSPILTQEMIDAAEAQGKTMLGLIDKVGPGDTHGATIGPRGGAFIGIEEWAPGVSPTSVHLDWSGEPIDEAHAAALQEGR